MAALLVAIAVMAIMMSVAMPVWKHDAQREKEAELVFRGNQYVRAIRLFQAKTRSFPTSVDMLVQQRFLRQKYLDPITGKEFNYLGAAMVGGQPGGGPTQANPGAFGAAGAGAARGNPVGQNGLTSNSLTPSSAGGLTPSTNGSVGMAGTGAGPVGMVASASSVPGGLIGVQSSSTDESIMVYNGRDHYNEWVFMYVAQNPGINGVGVGVGGRGGNNGGRIGPDGRGGQNGRGRGDGRGGRGGRGGFSGGFPFAVPDGRGRGGGH